MSLSIFVLRLVRCILRHIRNKEDGLNSFIAGCSAGWVATRVLSKDYWYFYLTLLGSRLLGSFHRQLIASRILNEENLHWHSYVMMTIAHFVHSYGYFLNPYILNQDMFGLYEKMSALGYN
jgi:hypothetical protein